MLFRLSPRERSGQPREPSTERGERDPGQDQRRRFRRRTWRAGCADDIPNAANAVREEVRAIGLNVVGQRSAGHALTGHVDGKCHGLIGIQPHQCSGQQEWSLEEKRRSGSHRQHDWRRLELEAAAPRQTRQLTLRVPRRRSRKAVRDAVECERSRVQNVGIDAAVEIDDLSRGAFADEVRLEILNGRVWLSAKDATARQILATWERAGATRIVNAEQTANDRLTLRLDGVSESEALDIVLRSASGYMAAARVNGPANASRFDRIVILPMSARHAVATPPAVAATALTPPTAAPATVPNPAWQSAVVRPVLDPDGRPVADDQADSAQVVGQQPPALPQRPSANTRVAVPNSSAPATAPIGVAVPGMPVPVPAPPGAPAQPPNPRPRGF